MRLGWLNLPQHDYALFLLLGIVAAIVACRISIAAKESCCRAGSELLAACGC